MNDLIEVREALGDPAPPSQAARAAARAALLREATRGAVAPRRRRRAGWVTGGVGLTAAAVAAALVMTSSAPSAVHTRNQRVTAVARLSARQILLDAATTAAAQPARTGTYWYVKEIDGPGPVSKTTVQSWYTWDGSVYTLLPRQHGVFLASPDAGFVVGASELTYQQIQRLPTDPSALAAWITRSFYHPVFRPVPSGLPRATYTPPPRTEIPGDVAISLGQLLGELPVPPAIRAAAYRALAAQPDVTKVSQTGGDVVLRISFPPPAANKFPDGRVPVGAGELRLTIDTSTLTLHAWTDYQGTSTILADRWTDSLPAVVSAGKNR